MAQNKRKLDIDDYSDPNDSQMVVKSSGGELIEINSWSAGKSKLSHPTTALTGHDGAVYSINFSPSGNNLLSSSQDGKIC